MKEWEIFEKSPLSTDEKLRNFPKYVRRQDISRFIALYELFKKIIDVKGSIVECGVHLGFSLFTFAKLSANLEPIAIDRKIIGFDTFEGFPSVSEKDELKDNYVDFKPSIDIYKELLDCIEAYDENRFLNQYTKIELIKGDAIYTIPKYVEQNKHLTIALLFLDFDLYEPTKIALELLVPRVVRGE